MILLYANMACKICSTSSLIAPSHGKSENVVVHVGRVVRPLVWVNWRTTTTHPPLSTTVGVQSSTLLMRIIGPDPWWIFFISLEQLIITITITPDK